MNWIIETPRLGLRYIAKDDFEELCSFLQNPEVMYAWEHGFTDEEVHQWIEKNLARYSKEGYSYFAAIEKSTGEMIGVIGPLIEEIEGVSHIGIAYILNNKYWSKGFATEGARACINYAFDQLNAAKVIAEIRPENAASRKVAERLGMKIEGQFVKHYNNKEMLHLIYSITK